MNARRTFILWIGLCCVLLSAVRAAAYYSPATGRWLGRDPIGEQGGMNLLAFVENSPVSFIDYSGFNKGDPWPSDIDPAFKERVEMWKQENGIKRTLTTKEVRTLYNAEMQEMGSMDKITRRGGNKRKTLSEHRRRGGGTRGSVSIKLGAAGAAVSAVTAAIVYFSVRNAMEDVRDQMAMGVAPPTGSPDAHLFDFVRNVDRGETAWADLDAITYVIESGGTGANALVMLSALDDAAHEE